MALSHTDLEMVTVRGVTFLVDPSTFVEGCTYLLVGSGTVEPFDSVLFRPQPFCLILAVEGARRRRETGPYKWATFF